MYVDGAVVMWAVFLCDRAQFAEWEDVGKGAAAVLLGGLFYRF